MAKKTAERGESLGWIFFLATSLVLLIPGTWVGHLILYEDVPFVGKLGVGAVLALITGGAATSCLNAALQYRARRRRRGEKKTEKKKSRK